MSQILMRYHHVYPEFALDVDLSIPDRGVTAIFGPSGCGKTTLLRLVAGLEATPRGFLKIGEDIWQEDAHSLPSHQRRLGYVFQDANLFPHLTVRQNLSYGEKRIPKQERLPSLTSVIDLLGIAHLLDRKPARLSGGERQRVAIARALAVNPRILLMDEPLAALDHARKQEILPYLQRMQRELQIPILYVSHSPDEVAQLADHLVVLQKGRCLASGPIQEVLSQHDLPVTLGDDACSVFDAVVGAHDANDHLLTLHVLRQTLLVREHPCEPNQRVRIRILARDVSLALDRQEHSSILNHLYVRVEDIQEDTHPAQCLVRLSLEGSPLLCRMTHRSRKALMITPGSWVWAQVKTMALLGPVSNFAGRNENQ